MWVGCPPCTPFLSIQCSVLCLGCLGRLPVTWSPGPRGTARDPSGAWLNLAIAVPIGAFC